MHRAGEEAPSGDWRLIGFNHWDFYLQAHFFTLILSSAGSFILYYFLFRTKMIPRLLSIWGVIAVSIVFIGTWIQVFGFDVDFVVYLQSGVFILFLISWLLIKGFRSPEQLATVS